MRKLAVGVTLMALAFGNNIVRADTIYMKNGSVIKGRVTVFSEEQFIVALSTGSGRVSQATIFVGDISKIEFDAGGLAQSDPAASHEIGSNRHDSTPIRDSGSNPQIDPPPVKADPAPSKKGKNRRDKNEQVTTDVTRPSQDNPTRDNPVRDPSTTDSSTKGQSDTGSRTTDRPVDPAPDRTADRPPDRTQDRVPDRSDPPAGDTSSETPSVVRKPAGAVKTASVDVIANRDWTSTGMLIRRGDRIRISASGNVTLDPANNLSSGPEGIDQADSKKLMGDRPTGSLIAVIGADNDEFIFIGRQAEFTAVRDGLLFLSVNEGTLADNTGSFKASIEVESDKKR